MSLVESGRALGKFSNENMGQERMKKSKTKSVEPFIRANPHMGEWEPSEYHGIIDKKAWDILMNTRVLFGLKAQGHLPTIERMLENGATWEEIGKKIGWCPETAKEDYERHIEYQHVQKRGEDKDADIL